MDINNHVNISGIVQKPGFIFHTNRGSSVVLTNNGKWAEAVGPGGIVVSNDPLETNVMYQVTQKLNFILLNFKI